MRMWPSQCDNLSILNIPVFGWAVSGYRPEVTIMIKCGFVLDVYGFCPNDYTSSAIDEESAPALRETTVWDCPDSDGGYSIEWRRNDPLKQSVTTSRSFEFDSNVTDVSNLHEEKHNLQSTSTDVGTSIVVKPLPANADSSIRCNFEFDSNVTNVSERQ
jgi:hypothetical protein